MKMYYLCPDLGIPVDGHKGASSHIRGFVNAMKDDGHSVTIITSCPARKATIDVPIRVIPRPTLIEGISEKQNPRTFRALRHIFYNGAIEKLLGEMIQENRPDLIYERYSPFSIAGGAFSRKFGIKHILEVNAPLAEQGKLYRKQALQEASELLELTAFFQAGHIITLTNQLKEWLTSLGISEDKISIRPCGVDEIAFNPAGPSYQERFAGKIVLGFVGSLKPWHDIEILCEIFRKISANPRYHLLVVGDGPVRKLVEALSREFPGRVTLTGAVEQQEVPKYIRAMDIALAPYPDMDLFYFSPLKAYEYMAAGRAIIATGIGQLQEIIEHGKTGWLVPAGKVDAWVEAIETLAVDEGLRKRLGAHAKEEVFCKHTWKNRAKAFCQIAENFFQEERKLDDQAKRCVLKTC